jgi:hypothetical protein
MPGNLRDFKNALNGCRSASATFVSRSSRFNWYRNSQGRQTCIVVSRTLHHRSEAAAVARNRNVALCGWHLHNIDEVGDSHSAMTILLLRLNVKYPAATSQYLDRVSQEFFCRRIPETGGSSRSLLHWRASSQWCEFKLYFSLDIRRCKCRPKSGVRRRSADVLLATRSDGRSGEIVPLGFADHE